MTTSCRTIVARISVALGLVAGAIACGTTPAGSLESTSATDEAVSMLCGPLQTRTCVDTGPGGVPFAKGPGAAGEKVSEKVICSCAPVTGLPDSTSTVPYPNVCAGGAKPAAAPVPYWLQGYGCTTGISYPFTAINRSGTASIWACPVGAPTVPPASVIHPDGGVNGCGTASSAHTVWKDVQMVGWGSGAYIDNACIGNPIDGWILVEVEDETVHLCCGSCPQPGACTGGCPIL